MRQVVYSKGALKTLRRIPAHDAERIMDKIAQYGGDPASQANNVRKLSGRDGMRLCGGDWRVIFEEDPSMIAVLAIGPRGGVYE